MEANARLGRPGVVTRALFKVGERMFGQGADDHRRIPDLRQQVRQGASYRAAGLFRRALAAARASGQIDRSTRDVANVPRAVRNAGSSILNQSRPH
jgi:hypothetical protein